MIIVDSRVGSGAEATRDRKSTDLSPFIRKMGVPCDKMELASGDACFEGNGPRGKIMIGIERKTLDDILGCVEDSRFSAHQRVGMAVDYGYSYLIIEGNWKPHENGMLMQNFPSGDGWRFFNHRSRPVMYSKLYRYLLSVSLTGVMVIYSRDMWHTAYNIVECFHYWQKKWDDHTSMRETQKIVIPMLSSKPPLVRRWAADIEGVGVKISDLAARSFGTPLAMAQAGEHDWMRIPGVGVKLAMKIVREIWGIK